MVTQSTAESTSTERLAAATLAAARPEHDPGTGTIATSINGSYPAVAAIIRSTSNDHLVLDTHVHFAPVDLNEGDESSLELQLLAYRAILSSLWRGVGDTATDSRDQHIQPFQSSGSPRRDLFPLAVAGDRPRADTSAIREPGSDTADVETLHPFPEVTVDSLVAEIDSWLRDRRKDAQTELSTKTLYRIEVEAWLQLLETQGEKSLADRLALLRSIGDEDDEDDVPLNDEATLAFMDFLAEVQFYGTKMSLSSANGWLCSEWTYDDDRSLVVWFQNRIATMVTAFGSDGKLMPHLGRSPSAASRLNAVKLLVDEGFFVWRSQCSS